MNQDTKIKKLIFVYNADTSLYSLVTYLSEKLSGSKQPVCNLCYLSYDVVRMNDKWKKLIASLPYQSEFLLRDRFLSRFPNFKDMSFPAVFADTGTALPEVIISSEEINSAHDISTLITIVQTALKQPSHSK